MVFVSFVVVVSGVVVFVVIVFLVIVHCLGHWQLNIKNSAEFGNTIITIITLYNGSRTVVNAPIEGNRRGMIRWLRFHN